MTLRKSSEHVSRLMNNNLNLLSRCTRSLARFERWMALVTQCKSGRQPARLCCPRLLGLLGQRFQAKPRWELHLLAGQTPNFLNSMSLLSRMILRTRTTTRLCLHWFSHLHWKYTLVFWLRISLKTPTRLSCLSRTVLRPAECLHLAAAWTCAKNEWYSCRSRTLTICHQHFWAKVLPSTMKI
jgi:hypothetical protein